MTYKRYFFQRLLMALATLFLVVTLTFIMMYFVPGDPFMNEKGLPKELHQAMRREHGLEDPFLVQYARHLRRAATLDFGYSLKFPGERVIDILRETFPISLLLGCEALLLALSCGLLLGTVAAAYQNRWQDHMATLLAIIGVSVPKFILAFLLQYFLAYKLQLFPVARWGEFSHTILPALALAALPMAYVARLTRASLLEVFRQDFIRTAYAKGLTKRQVILRHGVRNALIPVVGYLSQLVVTLMAGNFVVEKIFGIPGSGQWFVTSIADRDYPFIMGITLFYSTFLILVMFIVDLCYPLLDPRIRLKS